MAATRKPRAVYTEQMAGQICSLLSKGESLAAACRREGMPSANTVMSWVDSVEGFAARYTAARLIGFQLLADGLIELADDAGIDPNDKRIRVETRKWVLSKMIPKVYGDKIDHNIKGNVSVRVDEADAAL